MKLCYLFAASATAEKRMDKPWLCGPCKSNADCGPQSMWMKCETDSMATDEGGRCVCDNNWQDSNYDPMDGCELFKNGATMDVAECLYEPTVGPTPTGKPTPALCAICEADSDCQVEGWENQWMRCGTEQQCVCKKNWADSNGKRGDGCEAMVSGAMMADDECADTGPTIEPTPSKPPLGLCSRCKSDEDCQSEDKPNQWMRCGNSDRCVCKNNWIDSNGKRSDGCEEMETGAMMEDDMCKDIDGPDPTGNGPDPTGDKPDPTSDYPEKKERCCQMFRVGYTKDSEYRNVQYQCKHTDTDDTGYMNYACNGHPRLGEDSELPPMWVTYNATSHCYKMYGEMGMEGNWWKQEAKGDRMCPCIRSGFKYHHGKGDYDKEGYGTEGYGTDDKVPQDENDKKDKYPKPYGPGHVDPSKYFYEAECEFDFIDGCSKNNPASAKECPDFETCFQSRNPGLMLVNALTNENAPKSGARTQCDKDNFYSATDGRSSFKVQCACNSREGCRWNWKNDLAQKCISKDRCPGYEQIHWGRAKAAPRNVGRDGAEIKVRFYYPTLDVDYSKGWTIFLVIPHQIVSKFKRFSQSVYSLDVDHVSCHEEKDCSSTVLQFQSNEFQGHENWSNPGRYHDINILLHHLDFWQVDEMTPEAVRALFFNVKVAWMGGHHASLAKCIGMIESERPPSSPITAAVDQSRCKPGYKPENDDEGEKEDY